MLLDISDEDWKRTQAGFQQFATVLSSFREKIESAATDFSNFIQKHRPSIEKVISFLEDKDAIKRIFSAYLTSIHKDLLKHGYFIGLSGWGLSYAQQITELLQQGDQEAIDKYLLGLLRNIDNIDRMSEKWCKNEYFSVRSKFLLRGVRAHFEEDYIASIPILLPHIEAILIEFFIVAGLLSDTPDKFCGNTALSVLKTISIDEMCTELDKVHFRRFLHQKGVYDFRANKNSYLNRGAVLHGNCLSYDQEKWSAQLIYLLDFLCDLTSGEHSLFIEENGMRILKKNKTPDV